MANSYTKNRELVKKHYPTPLCDAYLAELDKVGFTQNQVERFLGRAIGTLISYWRCDFGKSDEWCLEMLKKLFDIIGFPS